MPRYACFADPYRGLPLLRHVLARREDEHYLTACGRRVHVASFDCRVGETPLCPECRS